MASYVLALLLMAQAFEVASVRPSAPGEDGFTIYPQPGGRINITKITVKRLIELAWHVPDSQIAGGPAWIDSDGYDIDAKAEGTPSLNLMGPFFQSLLKDRFKLAIHHETRVRPVFALVSAKLVSAKPKAANFSPAREGPCDPDICGLLIMGRSRINGRSVTLADFTQSVAMIVDRPVLDDTGLKGRFDIQLEWSPDQNPSIFTAVDEQLGLKLVSRKRPADILVIDHAEKASEN